jgi:tetratricopeptide (TPR) repeat protein
MFSSVIDLWSGLEEPSREPAHTTAGWLVSNVSQQCDGSAERLANLVTVTRFYNRRWMNVAVSRMFALGNAVFLTTAIMLAQSGDLGQKSARVKQLMAAGQFAEAVPISEELVRSLPSNPGLRLNLGLALQMSGRGREAIPQFEIVLKTEPNNFPALVSLGMAWLENGDPANAIAPLQKAIVLNANDVNARGMLAGGLMGLGRVKEAEVQYRKLTTLTPDDPKAWHGLGRVYETLSERAFEELSKTSQGSPQWLAMVADSRMAGRQYRSAFFFYRQALDKQPGFGPAHAGLADVYRATNHADWANDQERKAKAFPQPDCARDKGACDFAAGRYREATASPSPYWRARSYNELAKQAFLKLGALPESVELHAILADLAAGQRQYMEAVQHWRQALKLTPGDPGLDRQLAVSLQRAGDYQASLPILQRLQRQEPRSPDLNFFLGEAYLRLEQPDKALPSLETAARLDPQLLPARASLGLALMRLGRPAEAIPHLAAALEIDEDASLHFQLARAYQASGSAEKARQAMAQYQALQQKSEADKRDLEEKTQITPP